MLLKEKLLVVPDCHSKILLKYKIILPLIYLTKVLEENLD